MHIEIESTNLDKNNFNNKNRVGEVWYTVTQSALLFREGEKYPDKFEINLYFESHDLISGTGLQTQSAIVPIKAGKYHLNDKAFYINQRNQLMIDSTRLKSI